MIPESTDWDVTVTVTTHHRITVRGVPTVIARGEAAASVAMAQVRQMTPEDIRRHHPPYGTTTYLTGATPADPDPT